MLLLACIVGTIVIAGGCSVATQGSPSSTPGAPTTIAASADGLVSPRHPQCDVGQVLLHYLATGDNQGQPVLDQMYSQYVHVPVEQARSLADNYIQQCDQRLDTQAAASAQAAAQATAADQAAQQEAAARAAALRQQQELTAKETSACSAIGGRYRDGSCYSTVKGNPSGKPGADCVFPDGTPLFVGFNSDGSVNRGATRDFYPGCFT